MSEFKLGHMTVTPITDIDPFSLPLTGIFPTADPDLLSNHASWLQPEFLWDGHIHLAVRSWLLRDDHQTILIDACVGNHKERPLRVDWHQRNDTSWLKALSKAGVQPDDVDVVFCTHLHADHVGWNTKLEDGRWVPTFPNARYITSRTEYEYWERETAAAPAGQPVGHGCFDDSVRPVMEAGQMDLVTDGWELAPGLILESSPGHTPGHLSLCFSRDGTEGLFCGDAIHSPVQMIQPDWSSAFCADPDLARKTRIALLERLADTDTLLIPAHFRGKARCRVLSDGNSFLPKF